MSEPLNLVLLGSGAFGIPTFDHLLSQTAVFRVCLVVSQPDRGAGRHRKLQATPVGEWAEACKLPLLKPVDVNTESVINVIHDYKPDALVVIAFGQKLSQALLGNLFAINLHASLLPKYRGAAPINRAMMNNDKITGVSVISLAEKMDAGEIYAMSQTEIKTFETAGMLHERLALLGPSVVADTLVRKFITNDLEAQTQDESRVTVARKLKKEEGTVDFDAPCSNIRARIHGLNPWPGCCVRHGASGNLLKICLVKERPEIRHTALPGTILPDYTIACQTGSIQILQIQAAGRKVLPLDVFLNGYDLCPGSLLYSAYN